ncbi:GDSL-type esterase/lipase family protein [Actinoplanes xinjiangensis]|uniref:Lysophospholipase L1-like esterase n=1 Tax=Actinoplanes xinjiangensis TaxID=512350 RepID=A0A316FJT2_9ACTN|nr:GDSL-type esterase/lipase family protein [Actinoplanes xinjiangensis]PWK48372.1 lysophospholipase L1-like esterase [Actinoplanes xinjiangensis]GIF38873.1 lipase [Actinoplanes xinjiangensis]
MPVPPELLRGAAEAEVTARGLRPHRLPAWVREQFPDGQLLSMESQPSGVRLVFATTATRMDLVTHPTRIHYPGAGRPRGRIDVYVDGEPVVRDVLDGGDRIEVDLATGGTTFHTGQPHTTTVSGLPAGWHRVEIWLPHNESVELIDLRADAPIEPDHLERPVWVHHGSSISHGSNARGPSEIWPAVAARRAGVELRNLGLGGSALVDAFLARVIRDAPADLISVKLGINVVNLDGMRVRTFVPAVHGFLDTIRDGHPDVPLLLISPLFCGIHEDTPGPGAIDPTSIGSGQVRFLATGAPGDTAQGRLTLQVIRRELRSLAERRAADGNLHFLDGTMLYGPDDATELPLPDGLHPGAEAHQLIGTRFAEYAFTGRGPFAG